jgi:hypothetical protein
MYERIHAYAHNSVVRLASARLMTPCSEVDEPFLSTSLLGPAWGTISASSSLGVSYSISNRSCQGVAPVFLLGLVLTRLLSQSSNDARLLRPGIGFRGWGPFTRLPPRGIARWYSFMRATGAICCSLLSCARTKSGAALRVPLNLGSVPLTGTHPLQIHSQRAANLAPHVQHITTLPSMMFRNV